MPASIKHLRLMFTNDDAPMQLFAFWEGDQLYYQVKLLKLDEKNFKATVRYEDGTEARVKTSSLHVQFDSDDFPYQTEDEIVCCICEGGDSEEPNNLILCDVCQQGYHQECHEPKIMSKDLESEWTCDTCDYMLKQLAPKMLSSTPKIRPSAKPKKNKQIPPPPRVALKPIRPVSRKAPTELPPGTSIDGGCEEVLQVAKALIQTEEFMNSVAEEDPLIENAQQDKIEEHNEEKEQAQDQEQVKEETKKRKKTTKMRKVPQPA